MIQRRFVTLLTIIFLQAASCDRPTPEASTKPRAARVASLSPAATDLLVAMGLADQIIAVSNFEPPRQQTDALPRVGDYRTADWEKIAQLRPELIITQYRPDKVPEGFTERAAALKIRVLNRKIDSLDDAFLTIGELGQQLDAIDAANATQRRFQAAMQAVRDSVQNHPRPRTLLVVGETGLAAVGPGTFLSDLLDIAGGQNVLTDGADYPTLDRERLSMLNPDVIIQLLPGASEQVQKQAAAFWPTMAGLPAVQTGRVHVVTDPSVLMPGFAVTRTAEAFAALLHRPGPTTGRSPRFRRRRLATPVRRL